jgi:heme exporter protein D
MDLGSHAGFIIASYLVVAVVVAILIVWVTVDYFTQKRALAELERRGITRRSASARQSGVKEPA